MGIKESQKRGHSHISSTVFPEYAEFSIMGLWRKLPPPPCTSMAQVRQKSNTGTRCLDKVMLASGHERVDIGYGNISGSQSHQNQSEYLELLMHAPARRSLS